MADQLKAEGNAAFAAKNYNKAIELFTKAIGQDPQNHVLYSNRSACYASLKQWDEALADAIKTTEIKPDWSKGFSRKGAALHGKGDLIGALDAYDEALKLEPSNAQAKSGLNSVNEAIKREAQQDGVNPDIGLGSLFTDPNWYQKLANNPQTKAYLSQPDFMTKLQRIRENPNLIQTELQDQRIMQAVAVLFGLNVEVAKAPDAGEHSKADFEAEGAPSEQPPPETSPTSPKPTTKQEDEETKEKRAKADTEKALGTENYKKRQFDAAIEHYTNAWNLHKDITYLNNRAAAKLEKGDYDGCIEDCKLAVQEGRSVMADFKLIAKALGRIGNAYQKNDDLENAIEYYHRSLTEHRNPEILAKLRAAEKAKVERDRLSYIDPVKANEAREAGNKSFKDGDWPGAVKAYTEMVKRAPDDPRGYSNRAAALTKLMSFPEAVKDCDEAIKRDPKFMRAYIRKSQALLAMKEYSKSLDACTAAQEADTEGKHAAEIESIMRKCMETMYAAREGESEEQTMERIQKDPEIMAILTDPVMQSILQQAKQNPAALNDHMKSPIIRQKIQRLMMAGVIKLG